MSRELSNLATKARFAAERRLRDIHEEEFKSIHAEERVALGLPPEPFAPNASPSHAPAPCRLCGGPKVKDGSSSPYCAKCRPQAALNALEKNRVRAADKRKETPGKTCRRCGGPKAPGFPGLYCDTCKEATKLERVSKTTKAIAAKPAKQPVPARQKVPAVVRSAWARAHPNSAIRRKYPTRKALEKNWRPHELGISPQE